MSKVSSNQTAGAQVSGPAANEVNPAREIYTEFLTIWVDRIETDRTQLIDEMARESAPEKTADLAVKIKRVSREIDMVNCLINNGLNPITAADMIENLAAPETLSDLMPKLRMANDVWYALGLTGRA